MPKWLIVIIWIFIIALIGVNAYFFYSYFTFKPAPTPTPTPQAVSLTGEVKPGWQLPLGKGYCPNSYYLVGDSGAVEIKYTSQLVTSSDVSFKSYDNMTVKIDGTNLKADGNSCGDFVSVQNITNVGSTSNNDFRVQGKISCLPISDPNIVGSCVKVLQLGTVYLALTFGYNQDLSNFQIGDTATVTGIVDNNFDLTANPGLIDAIQVFTIVKN